MTTPPVVSVVIPCFNLGEYLDEAVRSVLNQSFQDFEILVVDDGSTDAPTQSLLARYDRPKTRVVRTENRGLPAARNVGVSRTSGRYLCMLDADDRLEPGYMERSVRVLDSEPSIAFVSHWLSTFGDEHWEWRPEACGLRDLLEKNMVNGAALMRREAFEAAGGFDESMRDGFEDWDFWLRLVKNGLRGHIIPEILFNYRRRTGSMSQVLTDADSEGYARLYRRLAEKHADVFLPRLPELLAASEAELADLRIHLHDLELEYFDWLEPGLHHASDDVAVLERKAERERLRRRDQEEREQLRSDLESARGRAAYLEGALSLARDDARGLRESLSWRITGPLRSVYGWWLRVRGGGGPR